MKEILIKIYPNCKENNIERYSDELASAMARYGIDNVNRMRAFLAQIGHESAQLCAVVENLKYSAKGLRALFGKYFPTDEVAKEYEYQPEKIANIIYANRMGNGDVASGDGWKYKGRGLIQLTGKDNYKKATERMYALPVGVDFVLQPELLETPKYAAQSAAWFWASNGLNSLADQLQKNEINVFKQITKRINGGYNGFTDRLWLYNNAKKYIV